MPKIEENTLLSKYTTWQIGGKADILVEVGSAKELLTTIQTAVEQSIPYTVLGGGSNVLISDDGIRGVVIINKSNKITIIGGEEEIHIINDKVEETRHKEIDTEKFYTFQDLDFAESGKETIIELDSGTGLAFAIRQTLREGLSGLQWFSGIPGTVGGALFNNIHGGTHHFSEYFDSAVIYDPETNKTKTVQKEFFEFGYDDSVLRNNKGIIVLTIRLKLYKGDNKQNEHAKWTAKEWAKRKKSQPQMTCGCVFKNISEKDKQRCKLPTASAGYIIDKELGLVGKQIGNAIVSDKHANFIENIDKKATANNVMKLIELIQTKTREKLGIELETEISFLGFDEE